jgi:hypothetical protein
LTGQRAVKTDEGMNLARQYGIPFIETSAKDGSNVDKIFVTMAQVMMKRAGDITEG